ncbi:MAG TPA: hypothetical protein VH593_21190 [Ktedonobacteraceae bacterium]
MPIPPALREIGDIACYRSHGNRRFLLWDKNVMVVAVRWATI